MQRIWTLASAVLVLALSHAARGDVSDPVAAGQEALRETGSAWYDNVSDGVQPVAVPLLGEEPRRGQWKAAPSGQMDWNWGFSWFGELFKAVAWLVLVLLIGLVIFALVRTYLNLAPVRSSVGNQADEVDGFPSDAQRIENLPLQPRSKQGDFLALARQHYEAGDFAEAIIYLFSYRLLQLDKAGLIRLTRGKTNRQYLLELGRFRDLQQLLGQTVVLFEDVFFGHRPLERERFEKCWNGNDQFQLLIAKAGQ